MIRVSHTLTYTSSIGFYESSVIDKLIELAKKPDKTDDEQAACLTLNDALPTVTQVRITVVQVDGRQKAKYEALTRSARNYFTEQSGIQLPFDGELDKEQQALLNIAFNAAAAIASTTGYATRETKAIVTDDGLEFEDTEWVGATLPSEYATISGWVEGLPATLQDAWGEYAYNANVDLWRRSGSESSKNFGAVSVS